MVKSPTEKDIDRMYNDTPEYGQSLEEYIHWELTTSSNYRERMQDPERRERAIHELVSKWRKAQIDHTEYKDKSPHLYYQAIVKHSVDWFEDPIKRTMREMDIPVKRFKQERIPEAPSKPKGKRTKQERRSRSTKKFLKKQKRKAKD